MEIASQFQDVSRRLLKRVLDITLEEVDFIPALLAFRAAKLLRLSPELPNKILAGTIHRKAKRLFNEKIAGAPGQAELQDMFRNSLQENKIAHISGKSQESLEWLADAHRIAETGFRFFARDEVANEQGVTFHGYTGAAYRRDLAAGHASLPLPVREFLTFMNVELTGGAMALDVLPGKLSDSEAADTYGRTQYNHSSGYYISDSRRVIVTEFELDSAQDQLEKELTHAALFAGEYYTADDTVESVRHELGHAFNDMLRVLTGRHFSDLPVFRRAYKNDITAMGGRNDAIAKNKHYHYFAQKNKTVARDEIFSELTAARFGGGNVGSVITTDWSHCYRAMDELYLDFCLAHHKGPEALLRYLDRLNPDPKATEGYVSARVASAFLTALCASAAFAQNAAPLRASVAAWLSVSDPVTVCKEFARLTAKKGRLVDLPNTAEVTCLLEEMPGFDAIRAEGKAAAKAKQPAYDFRTASPLVATSTPNLHL